MKPYTPPLERVWAEWHRRERLRKMKAERAARGLPEPPASPRAERVPPQSLEELFAISDRINREFVERSVPILQTCGVEEARELLAQYARDQNCRAALANPNPGVREVALEILRALAADGKAFAIAMLGELGCGTN